MVVNISDKLHLQREMSHICRTHRCRYRHYNIAALWLSNNFRQLNSTQSGTGVGSTHLYAGGQCRIRPHDIYPGGRIVLLIYIQSGAGSDTMVCRCFEVILTASIFLSVPAPRDRMCICNTAHTRHVRCSRQGSPPRHPASVSLAHNKLRTRSPLTAAQLPDLSATNLAENGDRQGMDAGLKAAKTGLTATDPDETARQSFSCIAMQ